MIEILDAILLGIVEGLTEFLPVSSTAHLIISEMLLGLPADNDFLNFFTVFIQLGAISAVAILYYKRLLMGLNLYYYLLCSFIPAVVFGILLPLIGLGLTWYFYLVLKSYAERPE